MVTKKFMVPIYGQEVYFVYSSINDCNEYVKKKFSAKPIVSPYTSAHVCEIETHDARNLVVFFNKSLIHKKVPPEQIAAVMSHEIFHLVGFVMDFAQVRYDFDNDEPFAYLVGYFTELFHKELFSIVNNS